MSSDEKGPLILPDIAAVQARQNKTRRAKFLAFELVPCLVFASRVVLLIAAVVFVGHWIASLKEVGAVHALNSQILMIEFVYLLFGWLTVEAVRELHLCRKLLERREADTAK